MTALDHSEYSNNFEGFNITDCTLRDRDAMYFLLREDYTRRSREAWDPDTEPPPSEGEIEKRLVTFRPSGPIGHGMRVGNVFIRGLGHAFIESVRPTADGWSTVIVSIDGQVYSRGPDFKGLEDPQPPLPEDEAKGRVEGGVHRLRAIAGQIYYVGGNNSAGRRLGVNHWEPLTLGIPNPPRKDNLFNYLNDIDGFAEDDLYAVGSDGQVFHFNGHLWRQLPFPSNIDLETVCCGEDGSVYVSGHRGTTFKGRDSRWKLLFDGSKSLPFRDMVWFEGRLWCTSDYGTWTIDGDTLAEPDLPEGFTAYSGHLSSRDGTLLLGGYGGAAFCRDGQWQRIFSTAMMSRRVDAD